MAQQAKCSTLLPEPLLHIALIEGQLGGQGKHQSQCVLDDGRCGITHCIADSNVLLQGCLDINVVGARGHDINKFEVRRGRHLRRCQGDFVGQDHRRIADSVGNLMGLCVGVNLPFRQG